MIRIGNLSAAASMVGALPRVGPDGGHALQLAHAKGLISAWLGLEHHTLTAAAAAVTPPTPESPDLGGTVGDVHGTVAAACRLFDEVQSRWPGLGRRPGAPGPAHRASGSVEPGPALGRLAADGSACGGGGSGPARWLKQA